ncbi:hypothetical protein [Schleiferilactobacillus shenzhenensis]|uniref:Uncharacterized protein n=1 Tax=Schleiferilactobacillus shenzhenensis LY-73 TaxID=1231336 RepID=U4TRI7_9LACO|nr:hypothetical protein [Schleiferilactobacillus shenzhenensis]ERL66070.1 hypothetical protein L248_1162 [Schleiferilactobacillus shenzhenensis LY-73]
MLLLKKRWWAIVLYLACITANAGVYQFYRLHPRTTPGAGTALPSGAANGLLVFAFLLVFIIMPLDKPITALLRTTPPEQIWRQAALLDLLVSGLTAAIMTAAAASTRDPLTFWLLTDWPDALKLLHYGMTTALWYWCFLAGCQRGSDWLNRHSRWVSGLLLVIIVYVLLTQFFSGLHAFNQSSAHHLVVFFATQTLLLPAGGLACAAVILWRQHVRPWLTA